MAWLFVSSAAAQETPLVETTLPPPESTAKTVSVPTPEPILAPAAVPNGTVIAIEIIDLVSTRTAVRDDLFNLKLAEPVMLNGEVVIPAGTSGKGQVVDAGKPGMGGKPGKLVLAGRYLEFDGRQLPIRGLKMSMTASDNTNGAMAASIAVGVFGLAVTGGHMEVQPGTRANAKLAAEFVPSKVVTPETPSNPLSDVAQPIIEPQTSE